MAAIELAQRARTLERVFRISAATVDAGLASGIYSIVKAEVEILGAPLPAASGFITSFRDSDTFQVQEFRSLYGTDTYRRYRDSTSWSAWRKAT